MLSLQSDQELPRIIGLYGPAFQSEQLALEATSLGFSGAIVYQLRVGNRKYALRIWPAFERSIPKLEALTRLLEDLHQQGITYVSPAVRKEDGSVVTISSAGRMIHIEPWLPGQPGTEISSSDEKLENMMLALARLHLAAAKHTPKQEHYSWLRPAHLGQSASLKHRLKKVEHHLKTGISGDFADQPFSGQSRNFHQRLQSVFRTQAASLWEELEKASRQCIPLQPVFKDLWREHVLFTGNKVTGMIDPAAFSCDSVLTDLTRLLGSVAGNDWSKWSEAIAIYQTVRPLNQTEEKMITVFDQSNLLLSAIGCFDKYTNIPPDADQASLRQKNRLSSRLEEYLNRLESYHSR